MRLRDRNKRPETAPAASAEEPASGRLSLRHRARAQAQSGPAPARTPRTFTIGFGSIVSMLVLLGLVTAWGVGASLLLVFGDRLSERLIAQTSEMQDAYEQRLQAYRAEVARLTLEIEQSRFDQTSVEGRVVEMGRRQRLIEARLVALKRVAELLGGQAAQGSAPPPLSATPGASRIADDGWVVPWPRKLDDLPPLPEPAFDSAPPIVRAQFLDTQRPDGGQELSSPEVERFLERMDRNLKQSETYQMSLLGDLRKSFDGKVSRIRGGFSLLGLTPEQAVVLRGRGLVSLPNIILPVSDEKTIFGESIAGIQRDFAVLHGFRPIVEALPVTRPTESQIRYSSGFGFRIHPITGVRKLHAGLDMAAPIGAPIKAAGSGVVLSAGWGGGYGNLVIIDHGGGLVTRYAHLSEILVSPRQPIAQGAPVGRMGSTGASTGSHLHFETRINGNPVNPACFILAGNQIFGGQPVPFGCEQPPAWRHSGREEDEDSDS